MSKFLAVLIVALLVVTMAGCASKGTDEATQGASMDVQNVVDPAEPVSDEETLSESVSDDENLFLDTMSEEEAATEAASEEEAMAEEGLLAASEPEDAVLRLVQPIKVDEGVAGINVYCNNPDITVEQVAFVDKRDHAESTKWDIETLIRNNADEPVCYYWTFAGDSRELEKVPPTFITLYGGESVWLENKRIDKDEFSLDHLPNIYIVGYTTVIPQISPEFTKFRKLSMKSDLKDGNYARVDVESIILVETDAERGWSSAFATVSSDRSVEAQITLSGLGTEKVIIPAGQAVEVEFPLKESDEPDDLTGVAVTATQI